MKSVSSESVHGDRRNRQYRVHTLPPVRSRVTDILDWNNHVVSGPLTHVIELVAVPLVTLNMRNQCTLCTAITRNRALLVAPQSAYSH